MNRLKFEFNYLIHKISVLFKVKMPMKIASMLPKRVQLWAFVLVYGSDGDGGSEEYSRKYDYFNEKYKVGM